MPEPPLIVIFFDDLPDFNFFQKNNAKRSSMLYSTKRPYHIYIDYSNFRQITPQHLNNSQTLISKNYPYFFSPKKAIDNGTDNLGIDFLL